MYKSVITGTVTNSMKGSGAKWDASNKKWNPSTSITMQTVLYNGIWLPSDPYLGAIWCIFGLSADGYSAIITNQIADIKIPEFVGKHEARLAGKSITIDQIGPWADRGGYMTCCVPTDAIEFTNKTYFPFIDPAVAATNQVDAYNGTHGVYGVMRPNNKASMLEWADCYRGSVGLKHPQVETEWYPSLTQQQYKADQGWKSMWIGLHMPDSVSSWALRVMVCTTVEVKTSEAVGGANPFFDEAAINMLLAISSADMGFYPASFNDLKKVLAAVRSKYKKYKPLIDVAAGYIPYGSTINEVLNTLLGK